MSKHITYRGITIDMESLMRENSKSVAIGNMKVNARGDQLGHDGKITKTADQIAREKHRKQTAVMNSGLKGSLPADDLSIDNTKATKSIKSAPAPTKTREVELPSGDIIIEDDNGTI